MLIVFDANLDILSSDLITDRTKVEIVREIMQDAIRTKSYMSGVTG